MELNSSSELFIRASFLCRNAAELRNADRSGPNVDLLQSPSRTREVQLLQNQRDRFIPDFCSQASPVCAHEPDSQSSGLSVVSTKSPVVFSGGNHGNRWMAADLPDPFGSNPHDGFKSVFVFFLGKILSVVQDLCPSEFCSQAADV